ncbi:MAG: hypothetical protein ABI718_00855 [Acidobacteriota bacterium]
MEPRSLLALVRSPLGLPEFEELDRRASVIALLPGCLEGVTTAVFDRLLLRRTTLIVCNGMNASGGALAIGLVADLHLLREGGTFGPAGRTWFARSVAAAIVRIGAPAGALLFRDEILESETALRHGICDLLVPDAEDSVEWVRSWVGRRSLLALGSAAHLLRTTAREPGERAEFGRLFATGQPQRGMRQFLESRAPGFSETMNVEIL